MRKSRLFLLSLAFLPFVSMAQVRIGYSYDAAGNRIKREIVMQTPNAKAGRQSFGSDAPAFSDMLCKHAVRIYPNPTDGILKVCFSGLGKTDKCSLGIYTAKGERVMAIEAASDNTEVNISSQPTGIYLLRITINNSSSTWKIIKK